MNITLRQLEIFYHCCQQQHFRKTAELLYMTPAAVSKQMANLSEQVGFALFELVGKKIILTPEAKLLLPYAKKTLDSAAEFNQQAAYLTNGHFKPIRISFGAGLDNITFKLMQAFSKQFSDIKFEAIIHRQHAKQITDLLDDKTNFHFSTRYESNSQLKQVKLFTLNFYLVCSAKHQLAQTKTAKLNQQTLITIPAEKSRLGKFNQTLLLESYPSVKEAILANLGIGFLPHNLVDGDANLHLVKKKSVFSKPVYAVYRKNTLDREIVLFTTFLQEHFAAL